MHQVLLEVVNVFTHCHNNLNTWNILLWGQNNLLGVENLHCGWLSEEEETDPEEEETDPKEKEAEPKEDSDGDDDEIIQLTPEPLCEELEELLREVRGQKRRKKETRWDK